MNNPFKKIFDFPKNNQEKLQNQGNLSYSGEPLVHDQLYGD